MRASCTMMSVPIWPAPASPTVTGLPSSALAFNASAMGDTLEEAVNRAYAGVEKIHFEGMHYRNDIGRAGVKHGQ